MKIFRIFFFLILLINVDSIMLYGENKNNTTFHIHGHFMGKKIKTILFSYIDINGNSITKKSNLVNNEFNFSGEIKEPETAWLRGDIASNWVRDSNSVHIFIEPTNIEISIEENNFKSLKMYGSKTQKQFDSLENSKSFIYKQMVPYINVLDSLGHEMNLALKEKDTSKADKMVDMRKKIVFNDMKSYYDSLKKIDLLFIFTHPNSYLSPYLLNIYYPSSILKDSAEIYFNKLNSKIQKSFFGIKIKEEFDKIEKIKIGSSFPNINGILLNDQKSSINNLLTTNYTLIIFWASWCPPCRSLAPSYKRIYENYHKKGLNVIAITQDTKKSEWESAIRKDSTAQINQFYPDEKYDISQIFNLNSIPAEILLKGNKVIAKYSGADNEHSNIKDLENKLKEIFHD